MVDENVYIARVNDKIIQVRITDDEISIIPPMFEASVETTGARTYSLLLDHGSYDVYVEKQSAKKYGVAIRGTSYDVVIGDRRDILLQKLGFSESNQSVDTDIRSPMPGLVLDVRVRAGDEILEGEGLLILEAMKMENEIKAPANGKVKAIHVNAGDAVKKNDLLIEFEG